jgi:hypothetical protein
MNFPMHQQLSLFPVSRHDTVAAAPTAHAGQRAARVNLRSRGTCPTLRRASADLVQPRSSAAAHGATLSAQ